MDKFKKTDTGGLPLRLDDLIWEQGSLDASNYGIYEALQADLLAYGTDYIVEGCTYAAPNITAGWIMLAGELLRVDAHAGSDDWFVKTITFDARGDKTFKDASSQSTYQVNRGVLSGASGTLDITAALRLEDKVIQLLATSTQQFAVANIPSLPASKTTSGAFADARIPSLNASKITAGIFAAARIPLATESAVGGRELSSQAETDTGTNDITIVTPLKLRTTVFVAGQIPNLAASKTTSGTFAAARIPQATESAVGGAEVGTSAEALALTSDVVMLTPLKASSITGGLITKMFDIGDWDMDATVQVTVAHGLTYSKIRKVTCLIRNDSDNDRRPLQQKYTGGTLEGIYADTSGTTVTLVRETAGHFDTTAHDQTSYNRGWIMIEHIP